MLVGVNLLTFAVCSYYDRCFIPRQKKEKKDRCFMLATVVATCHAIAFPHNNRAWALPKNICQCMGTVCGQRIDQGAHIRELVVLELRTDRQLVFA